MSRKWECCQKLQLLLLPLSIHCSSDSFGVEINAYPEVGHRGGQVLLGSTMRDQMRMLSERVCTLMAPTPFARKVCQIKTNRCRPVVAQLVALAVLSSFLIGQVPGDLTNKVLSNTPTPLEWSYRKDVQEVYVLFSASSHGRFVSDLDAEDISVLDDGGAPEKMLAFYSQRDLPLRMGLLIDTSPSVYSRFGFEQDAAHEFLTDVVRSDIDEAFVMGFGDYPQLMRTFTSSPVELWPAVASLVDQGDSTALFDAVVEGCRQLSNHPEDRFVARTLVVVSDGGENSSLATLYRAVLAAQESDVTIYTISTRTPWHHGDSAEGDRILKALAEETGGRALFPESPQRFRSAFSHIAEELHSRYAISYRPAHFVLDDHYRRIQINAERSGKKLKVHGRKGYYATAHADDIAQGK